MWRDARAAEGARLEIVCMPTKVYRGFESPSLRQYQEIKDQRMGLRHNFFDACYLSLIPQNLIAGSRATEGCKPRQVRKEATVAITDVCCG